MHGVCTVIKKSRVVGKQEKLPAAFQKVDRGGPRSTFPAQPGLAELPLVSAPPLQAESNWEEKLESNSCPCPQPFIKAPRAA